MDPCQTFLPHVSLYSFCILILFLANPTEKQTSTDNGFSINPQTCVFGRFSYPVESEFHVPPTEGVPEEVITGSIGQVVNNEIEVVVRGDLGDSNR